MDLAKVVEDWKSLHLKKCPLCECEVFAWENIFILPEYTNPGSVQRPRAFSVLPLVCKSCGYTVLVSAVALKLTPPSKGF
jgi:hypothetical protein